MLMKKPKTVYARDQVSHPPNARYYYTHYIYVEDLDITVWFWHFSLAMWSHLICALRHSSSYLPDIYISFAHVNEIDERCMQISLSFKIFFVVFFLGVCVCAIGCLCYRLHWWGNGMGSPCIRAACSDELSKLRLFDCDQFYYGNSVVWISPLKIGNLFFANSEVISTEKGLKFREKYMAHRRRRT